MKTYVVRLEGEEQERLRKAVSAGKAAAFKIRRANILLQSDVNGPGWIDTRIAEGLGVSVRSIESLRKRFVEEGLETCLQRKKQARSSASLKFDGEKEAHLVQLACSSPPPGRHRWSLRLLADRLVELEIFDSVSYETVRQTLKKTS